MKKTLLLSTCLLLASFVHSQSWRNQADSLVINHIFADKVSHVDIFAFPEMLSITDTVLLADGSILQVPYSSCYGYFVDNQPFANWSHPCKYCFVDASLNHSMVSRDMPPKANDLVDVSLCPRSMPNPRPVAGDTTFIRDYKSADTEHKWAVLICGNGSETRFWFDLASVYTVLANVYGYQEAQEGESWNGFVNRRIIATAPIDIKTLFILDNNNTSSALNETNPDGVGDFFNWSDVHEYAIHSYQNIRNIFSCFAGDDYCLQNYESEGLRKLTQEDQLFVYITGHGSTQRIGDDTTSFFYVQEGQGNNYYNCPKIYDDTLVSWLRDIDCSQITLVMQNCYSGGFIEKFLDDISNPDCLCKNRIGQSAASINGVSYAENYSVYVESNPVMGAEPLANEYTYYWTSAALGYYPFYKTKDYNGGVVIDKGPWTPSGRIVGNGHMNWNDYFGQYEEAPSHVQYDVNPDTDGDGVLSFYELFEFADKLDSWSRHGYYFPNHNDTTSEIFYPVFTPEHPQQRYESSFTQEAATLSGYEGQIDSIANSGTAMQPYRLCGDIWVSPDSELTMWDTIQAPRDVKVYIKPSGKLIMDGGTLTNLPESGSPMWQGVQVWGNAAKHQKAEQGRYWQGYLQLKNGATIENAITGIDVWKPGDETSTGGIVRAYDASFINNNTAVSFYPYENREESAYQPGTFVIHNNVSSFRNCLFTIDKDYIGPTLFERHVNLYRVRGVDFLGCDFSFHDNNYSWDWPIGLHAYDAGFRINSMCTSQMSPCPTYDRSSFYGFYKAVAVVSDGTVGLRPFTVKDTDFSGNGFGVFTVRSNFATVLNSSFSISHDSIPCAAGIFMEGTPHFTIEQDTITTVTPCPYMNYGIVIKDSRSQNLIYKNVLRNLYCANLSVGRNNVFNYRSDWNGPKTTVMGLEYRCNSNTNNVCDFYVLGDSEINGAGIQKVQGTVNQPANNTFTQGNYFNFMNHANYDINYYYDINVSNSNPSSVLKVNKIQTTDTIGCLTHYGQGGSSSSDTLAPVLSRGQRIQRENDYYNAYTAYHAMKALYESRIDGGDTEAELNDIQSATPSDLWDLRAQLLGHSPYLSYGVLTSTADRDDVFPQSVLFEILSSNPDELRNDTLIGYLQNMDHPLPDYMIGLLQQVASGVTARTAMEAQMAQYSQEYKLAAGDVVRSIANDSVIDKNALIAWLGSIEDIASDYEIISLYIEDGDFTSAMALANMMPTLYNMTGDDLTEHGDFMTMLNLYRGLHVDRRSTMQLDSTERAVVEHMADYGTGMPQAMAKTIMMEAYGYRYDDCPSGVDLVTLNRGMEPSFLEFSDSDMDRAMGLMVSVSPNPARTWVAVDYTLPIGADKAQMRIADIHGRTVSTYDLKGSESQRVLDLRDMVPGVYTYTVFCRKLSQTGKLVIVK